jgi:hypothetical protein
VEYYTDFFGPSGNSFVSLLPLGWHAPYHPSPYPQVVVILSGVFQWTASDGAARNFTQGEVVFGNDQGDCTLPCQEGPWSKGHDSRIVGTEQCLLLQVTYPKLSTVEYKPCWFG